MPYYANLDNDLPSPYKRKRAIFYRQGLKIYGLLPYILARKLKAQFFSGSFASSGMILSAGSFESNWTAIPYRQSPENLSALLDWLYGGKGFEVAIASEEDFDDNIFSGNVFRTPPKTWYPMGTTTREGFLCLREGMERSDIMGLLAPPKEAE